MYLLAEVRGNIVPVRAVFAQRTVSLHVGFAWLPVGVETELVLFPQEVAEVECVGVTLRLAVPHLHLREGPLYIGRHPGSWLTSLQQQRNWLKFGAREQAVAARDRVG